MEELDFHENSQEGKLFFIRFPQRVKNADTLGLEKLTKTWLLKTENLFVFEMSKTLGIEHEPLRLLVNFIRTIKSGDKKLITINANKSLQQVLREQGLAHLFNFNQNIHIKMQ